MATQKAEKKEPFFLRLALTDAQWQEITSSMYLRVQIGTEARVICRACGGHLSGPGASGHTTITDQGQDAERPCGVRLLERAMLGAQSTNQYLHTGTKVPDESDLIEVPGP